MTTKVTTKVTTKKHSKARLSAFLELAQILGGGALAISAGLTLLVGMPFIESLILLGSIAAVIALFSLGGGR